jgi:hypothetical protein
MKVVGAISWFDEDEDRLTACIDGLAVAGVDQIVTLDGPYAHYPHDNRARSPLNQHRAIVRACRHHRIPVASYLTRTPWASEPVKRTHLVALAHTYARAGRDWLLLIDADEVITSADSSPLADTTEDVATILITQAGVHPPDRHRRYLRAHRDGIRVGPHHYQYVDGDGRELISRHSKVPAVDLDVYAMHYPTRGESRQKARQAYYVARDAQGLEPAWEGPK